MSKEVVFALQLHLQIIYSNNTSHLLPIIMLRFHEYCKFAHTQSQVRILSTNLEIYLKIIKDNIVHVTSCKCFIENLN